ncbi:MAG TPA: hypothetical protein VFZ18_14655 [Longimicrobiaceae bacterium]
MLPLVERKEVAAWRDRPAADPAERWAAGAVRAIEEQIGRPDFEFRTDHPRLLVAEVQYSLPDVPFPTGGAERLRLELFARGWHRVELLLDGMARLGIAREPIVVRLVDGTEFEARVQADEEDVAAAERILREGAWRFDLGRPVLVAPTRIASVVVGPRLSDHGPGERAAPPGYR